MTSANNVMHKKVVEGEKVENWVTFMLHGGRTCDRLSSREIIELDIQIPCRSVSGGQRTTTYIHGAYRHVHLGPSARLAYDQDLETGLAASS